MIAAMSDPPPTLAWLAGNRIYTDVGGDPHESEFARQMHDRGVEIHKRNAWKYEGSGARFATGGLPAATTAGAVSPMPTIAHICRGREPGQVLYSLASADVTGVFALDLATGDEQRLFHSNQLRVEEIAPRPAEKTVACSLRADNGTVDLALLDTGRGGMQTITEGDSVDQAPRWREGHPGELVFMSAGIGRDEQGLYAALGPYSVEHLDLERGTMETLAEDPDHDLLAPQMAGDGTLYFIRRPHERPSGPSAWQVLRGILLFPMHFFWALFHIVNNFTASMSRKPLLRGGGPDPQVDERLLLWGQVVDLTERASGKRRKAGGDEAAIVPDSWELVRRPDGGEDEVLATGVLGFDLRPGGTVVYANGAAVFEIDASGTAKRIAKGAQIRQVVALG
jgi:hypothetical protein